MTDRGRGPGRPWQASVGKIGFYFARHGVLVHWNLAEIVNGVSGTNLGVDNWRRRFRDTCASLRLPSISPYDGTGRADPDLSHE